MQQIQIKGHLGKDAVIKSVSGQKDFLAFNVCVTEKFTNKSGEEIENSTWYSCISSYTQLAQYLKKGNMVFVQGELKASIYLNEKEGKASLDLGVRVSRIELLNNKKD
jgi:single-strand DNA-binding protein